MRQDFRNPAKDAAKELLKNWVAALPKFKFKSQGARREWKDYLVGCTNKDKRETARFVANVASKLDRRYRQRKHSLRFSYELECVLKEVWSKNIKINTSESFKDFFPLLSRVTVYGSYMRTAHIENFSYDYLLALLTGANIPGTGIYHA